MHIKRDGDVKKRNPLEDSYEREAADEQEDRLDEGEIIEEDFLGGKLMMFEVPLPKQLMRKLYSASYKLAIHEGFSEKEADQYANFLVWEYLKGYVKKYGLKKVNERIRQEREEDEEKKDE